MAANKRFRVPSHNGAVLAVPDLAAVPELIEKNRHLLSHSPVIIDGLPLADFREQARTEILTHCESSGSSAPLILAGHQPELSHPGVWVKNFVLNGLARKVGGIPLNLIVDSDILKSASLYVPVFQAGDPSTVRREPLAFDIYSGELPYEDSNVQNDELFRSLPVRAASLWRNWGYEPLLPRVWRSERTIGGAFTLARTDCERRWGCHNREMPVSQLSQTVAFGRFAKSILSDLERFRGVYNSAIQEYRRVHQIRSRSHPAPELVHGEAPFWERKRSKGLLHERATASSDIRSLRPRALTLTLFARLCLGDFFIHGIGGGTYDVVTDQIIREYFGIEPPAYLVVSATLLLPLPAFPSTTGTVRQEKRVIRDLRWNPERHIEPVGAAQPVLWELIAEKRRLRKAEPSLKERSARRDWFRALRSVTERLRTYVETQLPAAREKLRELQLECDANDVLQRRDYAWVLYPEAVLRPFLQRFLH